MSVRTLLGLGPRLLLALLPATICSSCVAFLGSEPDRQNANNAIDRGIRASSIDVEEIKEKIRFEFENYYPDPKSAEGLKNYITRLGDTCETREMIVCTHRISYSMYIYKYFFDIYLGKSEQSRAEYLVRISFPKEGEDVIPAIGIDVQVNYINDP